jgi:hypothetical protein
MGVKAFSIDYLVQAVNKMLSHIEELKKKGILYPLHTEQFYRQQYEVVVMKGVYPKPEDQKKIMHDYYKLKSAENHAKVFFAIKKSKKELEDSGCRDKFKGGRFTCPFCNGIAWFQEFPHQNKRKGLKAGCRNKCFSFCAQERELN